MVAFQLLLAPNSQAGVKIYPRMLDNMGHNYSSDQLLCLIKIYSQAIDILNLEKHGTNNESPLLRALYSTFLISSLEDDPDSDEESVFKNYKHSYKVISVDSVLAREMLALQQGMDAVQMNELVAQKLLELRPKFFMVSNFKNAFVNQYKEFVAQFAQKHAYFFDRTENAFFLDMDAQFLMVPKNWTTKLLVVRLLNLCMSLASELKQVVSAEVAGELEVTMEDQIRVKMKEVQVFGRLQRQAKVSHDLHQAYTQVIANQSHQQFRQLSRKEDFRSLLSTYWQKPQFTDIKYFYNQNYDQNDARTLEFIENRLYMAFDFGICHQRLPIVDGKNEILLAAFKKFQSIVTWEDIEPHN